MKDLADIVLLKGSHESFEAGMCAMEAAAYIAGEEYSDKPKCVSPALGAYVRRLNDVLPDDLRQRLKDYIPRLLNTAGDGKDQGRAFIAADHAVRYFAPQALRCAGSVAQAEMLEKLAPITTIEAAGAAGEAAGAAAGAAARAAAGDEASAAAWAAASAAAWAASAAATVWDHSFTLLDLLIEAAPHIEVQA